MNFPEKHVFDPVKGICFFNDAKFGTVRTITRDGEPWFVAADVCRILGLSNPTMAVSRLDEDERMTLSSTPGYSGNPTMAVSRLDERMTLSSTPEHSGNPTMAVSRLDDDERMTLSSSAGHSGNHTMAVSRLDDDERMTLSSTPGHTGHRGGAQSLIIVNEPGLYALILGSRKPEAKAFKRWIAHEVIPAVRKHGGYLTPSTIEELLDNPDLIVEMALKLKAEREGRLNNAKT